MKKLLLFLLVGFCCTAATTTFAKKTPTTVKDVGKVTAVITTCPLTDNAVPPNVITAVAIVNYANTCTEITQDNANNLKLKDAAIKNGNQDVGQQNLNVTNSANTHLNINNVVKTQQQATTAVNTANDKSRFVIPEVSQQTDIAIVYSLNFTPETGINTNTQELPPHLADVGVSD